MREEAMADFKAQWLTRPISNAIVNGVPGFQKAHGIVKRSILIAGHKTSVSLEDAFWRALKEIARAQNASLSHTVAEIDKARKQGNNLSSAIRLFVLDRALTPATREPAMLSSLEIEAASPNGALHSQ